MTTNTGDTLEPCPFCGGAPIRVKPIDPGEDEVHCRCGTYHETVALWNRRASPPAGEGEPVAWVETRALDILAAGEPFAMTTVSREGAGSRTPLYALPQPTTAGERGALDMICATATKADGSEPRRVYVDRVAGKVYEIGAYPPREPETSDRDAVERAIDTWRSAAFQEINAGKRAGYPWSTLPDAIIAALSPHTSGAGSVGTWRDGVPPQVWGRKYLLEIDGKVGVGFYMHGVRGSEGAWCHDLLEGPPRRISLNDPTRWMPIPAAPSSPEVRGEGHE